MSARADAPATPAADLPQAPANFVPAGTTAPGAVPVHGGDQRRGKADDRAAFPEGGHNPTGRGSDMLGPSLPGLRAMVSASLPLVDVDRLQPGVYVVLELGWREHPFLRSSFTIRTDLQIRQIRALGLTEVRYCPERSLLQPLPAAPARPATAAVDADPARPAAPPSVWGKAEPVSERQWQQASLRRVEAEFTGFAEQHQKLLAQLGSDATQARAAADGLGDQLHRAVAECELPGVRLLSERIAQQASSHEVTVTALALLLARDAGFSADAQRELALASLLHDIGKLRLPRFLHEDSGRMTEAERRSYRRHVELGVEMARSMQLPTNVIRAIAEHHERIDGSGFPAAVDGTQIALASRVLAIVNRYHNLLCPIASRTGLTPYQALQQMYGAERNHYDASLLSRFIRIMGVYPPGTLVELTDRRMAIVVASRPGASLSPRVQVLEHPDDEAPTTVIDIDPESELHVRCSAQPAQLNAKWASRSRRLARTPVYIEPQSAPEWAAWAASESGNVVEV